MGKHTQRAAALVNQLRQTGGGDEITDQIFGRRINTAYVFGVLIVKDWAGNVHDTEVLESEDYHTHAEDVMINWLASKYPNGIPFASKIIFYVTKSPCRKCTAGFYDRILGLYQEISKKHPSYISIVFSEYYLSSNLSSGSNQASHNMWDTIQEAQQAYRKVEEQIDKEGLKSFGVHGMLTIRHLNETKGGTQHRKIAFAHGIK